ncbi:MAG: hypothetical protein EZS28_018851 [Streblomastix strix]|uniref:Uncharacterized protein n=1 Tax=Streblomastix strix TaxID=222440 RepID=A0A5J4VT52_9EUKA|nr:MAG: hypothetical protein EZS28_018851 [Streblomastix strix]
MEQGTETLDKKQERDGSHIFRAIPLQINLQRAADQSDPQQVRQLYRSIRFSKTESRTITGSKSEENNQAISTTENANTDSTYSGSIKQDNRRTKLIKHPGRLFSKAKNIQSFGSGMVDNSNTGLTRNRGQQTHAQIRGNRRRRGRGRGGVAKRIFMTMEGGDLLDPRTYFEDWRSLDRLGEVQNKVDHDYTLVVKSSIVHMFTNRRQKTPYSWREISDSEPGEGDDEKEWYATSRKNRGIPHGLRVEQGKNYQQSFQTM